MIPAINRPGQPFRFRNLGALSRRIRLGPAVGRRTGRDTGVAPHLTAGQRRGAGQLRPAAVQAAANDAVQMSLTL
ncbi:hypothetical protein GCM10009743_40090 [Kribbella swartbergensis]